MATLLKLAENEQESHVVANGHSIQSEKAKPREIELSADDISHGVVLHFGGRRHEINGAAIDTGL